MCSKRIIAIGDVHGCSQAFDTIVDAIQLNQTDTLITLGDYIDRGPDSRNVIERLLELRQKCPLVPLIGNHEVMLLNALQDPAWVQLWLDCGGRETLQSYEIKDVGAIPPEHVEFIDSCALAYETDTHLFVHANYVHHQSLEDQDEQDLLWKHLHARVPKPHVSGKTAIVGHTPQPNGEILDLGHLICIDTHCYGAGYLTAVEVNSGEIWQADKMGRLRRP